MRRLMGLIRCCWVGEGEGEGGSGVLLTLWTLHDASWCGICRCGEMGGRPLLVAAGNANA